MRPEKFIIIILLITQIKQFDLFTKSLYIREEDNLKIDMNNYLSFYTSSINFSSNNELLKLPGLVSMSTDLILPKIPFNILEFKAANNHFFILEKDKKTFYDIHLTNDQEYKQIESKVKEYLTINENIGCSDIIIIENKVFLLCYDLVQMKNAVNVEDKIEYSVLVYDYFVNEIEGAAKFKTNRMSDPKFKIFEKIDERFFEKNKSLKFILFDKELNSDVFGTNKGFVFIHLKLKNSDSSKYSVIGIKRKNYEELFFSKIPTNLKIENIIISSTEIFFVIKKEVEKQKIIGNVFSCTIILEEDLKDTKFEKCNNFLEENVENFFMKNNHIIYTTTKKEMFFCTDGTSNCKKGKIQADWKIEKIMLEDTQGVVIISIHNNFIMFINDYKNDKFTWLYENIKNINDFKLFKSFEQNLNKFFLLSFYKKGFNKRDITFQNELVINSSMFTELEPVSLYLENTEIMKLNIRPWNGDRLVDLNENFNYNVVKTDNDKYKLKLGWSGNNLNFENNEETFVYYYNMGEFRIHSKSLKRINNIKIHSDNENNLYVFFDKGIVSLSCIFKEKKNVFSYICKEKGFVKLEEIVEVKDIIGFSSVGNYVLVMHKDSEKTFVFDKFEEKIVKMAKPENFNNYKNCKNKENYFFCFYRNGDKNMDYLRFYTIGENEIIEIISLFIEFNDFIAELRNSKRKNELTEIRINNLQFNSTNKNSFIIHFHMIYNDTNLENVFYKFKIKNKNDTFKSIIKLIDFENNGDIKRNSEMYFLESQVLFLTKDPKFKLFCYQGSSYYVFEYIDAKEIYQTLSINSNSILGMVYKSHQNDKYYYAIFDITENAVKQLIRNEEIPQFDQDTMKLYFIKIDNSRLLITLFNLKEKKSVFSYVYYNKGPIMITNEIDNGILINDSVYHIQATEDYTFNLSEYKYLIKEDLILDEKTQPFVIDFNKYISIKGNLKNIDFFKKDNFVDSAKIDLPLTSETTEVVSDIASNHIFIKSFGENFVYQLKKGNEFIVETDKNKKQIVFNFDPKISCEDITLTKESLVCIWINKNISYISIKSFKNLEKKEEVFELNNYGTHPVVIEDNSSFFTILLGNISRNKILVYRFDRDSKGKEYNLKIISKKTLIVSNLKVTNFYPFLNTQTSMLSVMIFDAVNNNILIYHADLKDLENKKTLRKSIDLNYLEPLFDKMKCSQNKEENISFDCTLFSSARIYLMKISKSLETNFSEFTWNYDIKEDFHNVLYSNTFLKDYDISLQQKDQYLFLMDKNTETENSIIVYKKDSQNPYSYYIHKMDKNYFVKTMQIVGEFLVVYYVYRLKIIKTVFRIKDYQLHILKPQKFINEKISFVTHFLNSNNYSLQFKFSSPVLEKEVVEKKGKGMLIFLIVTIMIVSLLILISILTMIILIKKRKKGSNHNLTMNDTLNDPSFRISRMD